MAWLTPLARKDLPDLEDALQQIEKSMGGFVPNSLLTMARKPELVLAFAALTAAVMKPGTVPIPLKRLVGHMASRTAGCQYCVAHTAHTSQHAGNEAEKIAAVFEYETNPIFDEAERAALQFAQCAASVPNCVTETEFTALAAHFDETQIVEITAVISMFGFLNRWNDTMATDLEAIPLSVAQSVLSGTEWTVGKHGPKN
ncbi:MAG: carboxymuconolactone decarboxylase family protein [Proteobacteria bacterium]|nr:carboxymuconolactone decarboxylase family protein [Pseudomonadota bacterium]